MHETCRASLFYVGKVTLSGQIAIINKITWGKRYVYIIAGG